MDGRAVKLLMLLTEIVGVDTLPVTKPVILPLMFIDDTLLALMVEATRLTVEMLLVTT
jgi:hypothetical protein